MTTLTPEERHDAVAATREFIELARAQTTGAIGLATQGAIDRRDLELWDSIYGTFTVNAETAQAAVDKIVDHFYTRLRLAASITIMLASQVAASKDTTTVAILDEIEVDLIAHLDPSQ